jgi:hypothetical protein
VHENARGITVKNAVLEKLSLGEKPYLSLEPDQNISLHQAQQINDGTL